MSTQCRPYDSLGLGRIRSQRSCPHALLRRYMPAGRFCALNHHGCCFSYPPPHPPPPAGEGGHPLATCLTPFSGGSAQPSPPPRPPRTSTSRGATLPPDS